MVEAIYSLYGGLMEDEDPPTPKLSRKRQLTASDGLASACARFAWYEANSRIPRSINSYLRRRFMYGNLHEEKIVDELSSLQDKGWAIKGAQLNLSMWGVKGAIDLLAGEPTPILEEVMVETEVEGEGRLDEKGNIKLIGTGKFEYVRTELRWKMLEIKTMNPEDFKKFQDIGLLAFPRYREQAMFYLKALSLLPWRREKDQIAKGILLAENTFPLGELHAHEFELDQDLIDEMETHNDEISYLIKLPYPPDRPFPQNSSKCKHCFRKAECWGLTPQGRKASLEDLVEPEKFTSLLVKYLREKRVVEEATLALDDTKMNFRNYLQREGFNSVRAEIEAGLSFNVDLTQIHVAAYKVEASNQTRFTVT